MKQNKLFQKIEPLLTNPLSMRELMIRLHVAEKDRSTIRRSIRELAKEGVIVKIRGGRYGLPDEMNLVTGRVQGHPDRYGFLIPDDEKEADVYLSARNFDEAMHGDHVVVRVEKTRSDGRREGRVIQVLQRANEFMPGVFRAHRGGGFVESFDRRVVHDIFVSASDTRGAKDGQAVVAKVIEYPGKRTKPYGKIDKILGDVDDPAVEIEVVKAKYRLKSKFPSAVVKQAKASKAPSKKDIAERLDLRKHQIVTIDGETAKDFDDAVEVTSTKEGNYQLGVHIADVSHYVTEGSPLDKEALERATSVYFPGSVTPMLPFELSNDLCSLNPKVDRLTMSCFMTFDKSGELLKYSIKETVIRSAERMTYTDVAAIIERSDPDLLKRYKKHIDSFDRMAKLAAILRKRRFADGALDFDLPEPEIILDVTGKPENIITAKRNVAHRLIEEFMLVANKTVATRLINAKYPSLFRVHEEPDPLKVEAFSEFIETLGHKVRKSANITGKNFQKIMKAFDGRPEERLVTTVLLRSMKQARYAVENVGHFGLAFPRYTHFTSPIRRYPDLVIHRLLKDIINKNRRREYWEERLGDIANHTSTAERVADEAEREVVKLRKTQYMAERVGEVYEGVISGVTSFGFFVELVEAPVEGLVRLTSLADDYYHYSESDHALYGKRTKKRFRLGDLVTIVVENVSVMRRQIDFRLEEFEERGPKTKAGKRSRKNSKTKTKPAKKKAARKKKRSRR